MLRIALNSLHQDLTKVLVQAQLVRPPYTKAIISFLEIAQMGAAKPPHANPAIWCQTPMRAFLNVSIPKCPTTLAGAWIYRPIPTPESLNFVGKFLLPKTTQMPMPRTKPVPVLLADDPYGATTNSSRHNGTTFSRTPVNPHLNPTELNSNPKST